ncbi:putative UPF0481 protein At3g02645 isoform X2 [Momordica charantia]|uniref:UPF0481 protein At3g02645 isoform X2 n=1 Tax=Momordica charantia TaxID=3673 RepID=A0A6J1DUS9_MOMCH|nr:putative UPF0481 protein At3g02645 isoform X2 [Momordica charantia]
MHFFSKAQTIPKKHLHSQWTPHSKPTKTLHETLWLVQISQLLEPNNLQTALQTPTSIFKIADSITKNNPEAYFPRRVALGPYHHFKNDLHKMQLFKLHNTIKARETFHLQELSHIMDELKHLEIKIRSCFDHFLDIGSEALARIMLIDGLFLIQLLVISTDEKDELRSARPDLCLPSPFPLFVEQQLYSHLIEGNLMTQDEFVKDILKLENQIPLFVLKTILPENFGNNLHLLFFKFCNFVSPKQLPPHDMPDLMSLSGYTNLSQIIDQSHHLLHFLYLLILDRRLSVDQAVAMALFRTSFLVELLNVLSSVLQIGFLQQLSEAAGLLQSLFGLLGRVGSSSSSSGEDMDSPPLIPSASELKRVRVKFDGRYNDFHESMRFEQESKKVCLEMPSMAINVFSEVVFRNLVAFEAATKKNATWFAFYVALMSGLITTAKDVKILKQAEIIESHWGSEEEVVKLFDGLRNLLELHNQQMSYSSGRIMEMAEIQIVKDINFYYESCWKVKAKRFIKRFVNPILKVIFLILVILLIVVVVLRTSCGWFSCSRVLHVLSV